MKQPTVSERLRSYMSRSGYDILTLGHEQHLKYINVCNGIGNL
jgi:hypothetical protein